MDSASMAWGLIHTLAVWTCTAVQDAWSGFHSVHTGGVREDDNEEGDVCKGPLLSLQALQIFLFFLF